MSIDTEMSEITTKIARLTAARLRLQNYAAESAYDLGDKPHASVQSYCRMASHGIVVMGACGQCSD